jgi:hypothetical protein
MRINLLLTLFLFYLERKNIEPILITELLVWSPISVNWHCIKPTVYIKIYDKYENSIWGACLTDLNKLFLEENVGGFDLLLRAGLGVLAILALAMDFTNTYPWNWGFALVAFVGLYSSILRHCIFYSFLGINTTKR